MIESIKIKLKAETIELSLEEARELYGELSEFFNKPQIPLPYILYIYQQTRPYTLTTSLYDTTMKLTNGYTVLPSMADSR